MRRFILALVLGVVVGSAEAAFISRADGQEYYDDVLNITWTADASLWKTKNLRGVVRGVIPHKIDY